MPLLTEELIARGGTKLEATRFIVERGISGIPVPRSTWHYEGDQLSRIRSEFEEMKKPVIARGSNVADLRWGIDVYRTIENIKSWSDLETAVQRIHQQGKEESMISHCHDGNAPYDPQVHVLIQEQSLSPFVGTMMRHPNKPWEILLEWWNRKTNDFWSAQYSNSKDPGRLFFKEYHSDMDDHPHSVTTDELEGAVRLFQRVENAGLLDPAVSHVVEFGLRPLQFYQLKLFKMLDAQPRTSDEIGVDKLNEYYKHFELPTFDDPSIPIIRAREVFGRSPKGGISVPFHTTYSVSNLPKDELRDNPYGLAVLGKIRTTSSHQTRLGNLQVLCSANKLMESSTGYIHDFLSHGHYRLMAKAGITLVHTMIRLSGQWIGRNQTSYDLESGHFSEFKDGARVYASGGSAVIVPEKYAVKL